MKRILSLLLVAVFLLSACQTAVDTSSQQPTDTSSQTSEEVDDGVIDYTLVSVGKPYTYTAEPNSTYSDKFGQQLTDGQKTANIGAHYVDPRMVGFSDDCTFQIDLGEDGKRISSIVARSLDMSIDGVTLAATATFRASNDGKKFKTLGVIPFTSKGEHTVSEARLVLGEKQIADYRYIRIYVKRGAGYFYFIDEIEVYADVKPKQTPDTVALSYKNENINRNAWQALSTGVEALPLSTENVVRGAKYTFKNVSFDKRAPKNETFLTDGERTVRYFGEDVWVGINGNTDKTPSINFDLGKKRKDIYSFKVYALGGGIDVKFPDYIDVLASNDNKNYTLVGRMYAPLSGNNYTYTHLLPQYIEARYIRFEFPKAETNYWVEEIEIYAGYNEEYTGVLYPELNFPKVTEDLYWDASEPDYKTKQNLLLGNIQQVASSYYAEIDNTREGNQQESPANSPVLTDGKLCQSPTLYCYSGEFFYARNGGALDFFYDLGKLSTIEGFNVNLLEHVEWGIARPKHIDVFLSDDGTNWYKVYSYHRSADEVLSDSAILLDFGETLDTAYAARFVRFRIEGAATFIDELEAFGTKEVKSSTKRLTDSGIKPVIFYTNAETAQYATVNNTNINASDIAIIYSNGTKPEMLLPFVAYLDKDGNIKDTFMDGFLIGPYGPLPSSAMPHQLNYKQDWEYCKDNYFNGSCNLDVLEQTVGTVKEALGLTDYKVKIYFTMMTLRKEVTDFGDVDGDGVSENLSVAADREKVVDWFTNLCISEFNARNYQNLEIDGFYWVNEAVIWENDDADIIAEVGTYVEKTGYNFLWVPYYVANRYYLGYELGFDAVCMQPNAVFSTDAPLWRIPSAAQLTKFRNMCVEIEHSYQCLGDPAFARTYMLYLYYGALTGYMDSIHVYYDDLENFAKLAYSDTELCRMQYDATYHFIKHDLDITPDKKADVKLSTAKDTILDGNLNSENSLSLFTLASAPEHGYVALSSDGTFRYYPDKGYTGNDKFTYTYNNYLGESEVCVVEIEVK